MKMKIPRWQSFLSGLAGLLCMMACSEPPRALGSEFEIRTDVKKSAVAQEMMLVEHDFAAGEGSGWHTHPGVEIAYVLDGTFELRVAGEKPRLVAPGDTFRVARDTPHELRNVGKTEGRVVISYLLDKGGPWKVAVEAPHEGSSGSPPNPTKAPTP